MEKYIAKTDGILEQTEDLNLCYNVWLYPAF
jgi:hypothetical protein